MNKKSLIPVIAGVLVVAIAIGLFFILKPAKLSLGLGVVVSAKATNANADKDGQGQATVTAAAVLVDSKGKIVNVFIDCADSKIAYTNEGKAVATSDFKTKYELGDDYKMVTYGGAAKEWYEQIDALCALLVGKTVEEAKALIADDGKGVENVVNAGCTITISDYIAAVEKAVANAKPSNATSKSTLKLGIDVAETLKDATADRDGSNKVATTIVAAAMSGDTVVAASSDAVEVTFSFDQEGKSTFDATKAIQTKHELGDDYKMVTYGGAAKEWYEQANAFDAACAGKTVAEITALMGSDSKPVADAIAGCTIKIDGFVAALAKLQG